MSKAEDFDAALKLIAEAMAKLEPYLEGKTVGAMMLRPTLDHLHLAAAGVQLQRLSIRETAGGK